MVYIGIVGSRLWDDISKVQEMVDISVNKFGKEHICIVSGGSVGADKLGKEAALRSGVLYKEFNPAHTLHNKYSVKPKEWFGKQYTPANFFERNVFIAELSDYLFAFIPTGVPAHGTMHTVGVMEKLGKPTKIIE